MSLNRPNPFIYKWAETALTNKEATVVIPPNKDEGVNTANGRASIETGFPAITMKSVLQGGVPPWGSDHNGILYKITEGIQWTQAGGIATFNPELCNRIGGYAKGALLQSTKIDYPWVLWLSLSDNNKNSPAETDLTITQSGDWLKFPAVSDQDGNMLMYDNDGKLFVPSAAYTIWMYVDSEKGNDITGDGSEQKPFRSIYKAILSTPDYVSVYISLNADVTTPYYYLYDIINDHGHVRCNEKGQFVWDAEGRLGYNKSIWTQVKKKDTGEIVEEAYSEQSLNMGSRKVTITTYNDTEKLKRAEEGKKAGSPDNVDNLADSKRPEITFLWRVYKARVVYVSLQGDEDNFSISFNSVKFMIDNVDLLSDIISTDKSEKKYYVKDYETSDKSVLQQTDLDGYIMFPLVGVLWSGGSFNFQGVVFDKFATGDYRCFAGGGGGSKTYYVIGYCQFYEPFQGKFHFGSEAAQITVNTLPSDPNKKLILRYVENGQNVEKIYDYIDYNQYEFLSRIEAYNNVTPVRNPNDNYQGLITNYQIKGWKEWWKNNNPEWLRQNGFADWL